MVKLVYDARVKRFRYPEGSFASAAAVQYQTEKFLKTKQSELVMLANRLANDPLNVTLQKEVASTLKDIHITAGALAAGGSNNLYANDYLVLARGLKRQYGLTDNDPQEYGLKYLYQDIATGYTSESQLTNRLKMYANSSKTAYNEIERVKKKDAGFTEGLRQLAFGEHCKECQLYSSFGWVGIDKLILPTMGCSCLTNCKCTIIYR